MGYFFADSPVGLLTWIYEGIVSTVDNFDWDDDDGKCFFFIRYRPLSP